ncbi:MAG: DUF4340 domain-containing protein [Deltaproteobacteria bacterium]|jgi:hypothetical protein|nr:DUF4340 domain-containing protein [Deltaproteobacteria bacterium]MBW2482579.1 DUF4340 domain-containing protein [Deltaproteobacteria bacterium]
MKIKKEYIILALVIVALSVYLVMRTSDRTQYELPDIPRLEAKEISKLEITRDKVVMAIHKKDEKWYIGPNEYPADASKIKNMLNAIENLTLTALVSESKNYNLYDLDAEKKINVKAWQADKLERDVDLGKTASSFRHTFVKLAGDERVYHARGNFRNNFDYTEDVLRDKLVLALNTADIQQIQITRDQQSLTLNKRQAPVEVKAEADAKQGETTQEADQPLWQSADGRPVGEAVVEQILNTAARLQCEKFINDRRKDEFTSPLYTLQMKGAQEYSLSIFAKTDEKDTNYPSVSSGSNYAFLLSDSQVDRLMKDPIITPAQPEAGEAESETEDTKSD